MADSLIGYASTSLTDPPTAADSLIGYAVAQLRNPHRPIAVMVAGNLVHIPLATWNGSDLV